MFSGNRNTDFDQMSPCRFSAETFINKNAGENSSISIPVLSNQNEQNSAKAMTVRTRNCKRSGGKSSYRHVPHCQKPAHLVARRNARERRRVQAVNNAFLKLRRHVPFESKHKRLSKVKTLRGAIEYINHLQDMIMEYDQKHYDKIQNQNGIYVQNYSGIFRNICPKERFEQYHSVSECPVQVVGITKDIRSSIGVNNGTCSEHINELPEYGSLGMNEISVLPDT